MQVLANCMLTNGATDHSQAVHTSDDNSVVVTFVVNGAFNIDVTLQGSDDLSNWSDIDTTTIAGPGSQPYTAQWLPSLFRNEYVRLMYVSAGDQLVDVFINLKKT
mgnify:CR=1 FL=1